MLETVIGSRQFGISEFSLETQEFLRHLVPYIPGSRKVSNRHPQLIHRQLKSEMAILYLIPKLFKSVGNSFVKHCKYDPRQTFSKERFPKQCFRSCNPLHDKI